MVEEHFTCFMLILKLGCSENMADFLILGECQTVIFRMNVKEVGYTHLPGAAKGCPNH